TRREVTRIDRADRIHARPLPRYLSRTVSAGLSWPVEHEPRPPLLDDLLLGGRREADVDRQRADSETGGARATSTVPSLSVLAQSDPEGEASVYLVPDHVDARRNIDRRAGEQGVCRHWIDPGRIAHVEMEVGRVAERHASRRAGERASQAHEDAILDRGAHE